MYSSIAATVLVVIAIGVAAFQVALATGAPWGEWAFGGQSRGVLPRHLRIASACSLVVYALQASFYASVALWWGSSWFSPTATTWLSWIFVAFFALGTLMNGISRSRRERALWTPVVAVSLVCALMVALT